MRTGCQSSRNTGFWCRTGGPTAGAEPRIGRLKSSTGFSLSVCAHTRHKPPTENANMQGDQKVIDSMNAGLTIELTAINMYFIQSRMCADWGFHRLAKHFYDESIEEMQHAQLLIDRILLLEGVPEIARYDVIRVGKTVPEQLDHSLTLEQKASAAYNEAVSLAIECRDAVSREIMEKILAETEESIDWAETQINLISTTGLELYLANQMGEEGG